jgi:hypothetical protein
MNKQGVAYVRELHPPYPLTEFTVTFHQPNRIMP